MFIRTATMNYAEYTALKLIIQQQNVMSAVMRSIMPI